VGIIFFFSFLSKKFINLKFIFYKNL